MNVEHEKKNEDILEHIEIEIEIQNVKRALNIFLFNFNFGQLCAIKYR